MRNYFKPISISLSPNVEKDDVKIALNLLVRPWLWRGSSLRAATKQSQTRETTQPMGLLRRPAFWLSPEHRLAPRNDAIREFEKEFKKYLGVKYAFSFNSGRSALYAILKVLCEAEALKAGDGVALQAFTCNAVPNPVLWADLEPVYIDCDRENFNIDIEDLKIKIKNLSDFGNPPKILIVQHTFGLPANMDQIRPLCAENNLILIEDCAHSLGAEFNGIKVGSHSKAAFFSFSRDKVISSVYGGMAVTNDDELGKKLEDLQREFGQPGYFWTLQQILHPILLNFIILPIYNFLDLGKIMLVLSQWTHVLSKAVSWQEKRGEKPDYFPRALPNALAMMALHQFNKLDKFYSHRKHTADFYRENLKNTKFILPSEAPESKQSYLRFTVKHSKAHDIIYEAWHKQNILIGDWYTTPIAPSDTNIDEIKYKIGMCPNAEDLAKRTINLPTHINISEADAQRIVSFLRKWK